MIKLYGFPSTRSTRVSWVLEELGIKWQYHPVDLFKREHLQPEFVALNVNAKVPVLVDKDIIISESAAICQYLAEKYGRDKLLPLMSTPESAIYHQWFSFIITELEQPLWTIAKHSLVLPMDKRCPDIVAIAKWEFEKATIVAEKQLNNRSFICGEQFTIVDVLLAHTLNWANNFGQVLPKILTSYRKRLSQRPALSRAIEKETKSS